jgi:DNA-directed RNA polymerase specialized sigma24 family protein
LIELTRQEISDRGTDELSRRLAAIRAGGDACAQAAKAILFEFISGRDGQASRLDRKIKKTLARLGFPWDESSDHYHEALEYVERRVFKPEALRVALVNFDPQLGALEVWLMNRCDFALRDWAKRRPRASQSLTMESEIPAPALELAEPSPMRDHIEQCLRKLKSIQRACVLLVIACHRKLSSDDVADIAQAAARPLAEIERDVSQLCDDAPADGAVRRDAETKLELTFQLRRKLQQQRDALRESLSRLGAPADELDRLELESRELTEQEIRHRFEGERPAEALVRQRRNDCFRLALVARRWWRANSRWKNALDEEQRLPAVTTVCHKKIAKVLGSSPGSVSQNLFRARKEMGQQCQRLFVSLSV